MRTVALISFATFAAAAVACSPAESAPTEPPPVPVIGAVAQPEEAPAASSQYTVEGMHCGSCANSIRTTVTAMDGVVGCELTYEDAVLTVHWAESADDDAILTAVADMGFTIAIAGGEAAAPAEDGADGP